MNKTRLEAFSDGVIAIIITIMVLEIHVPHISGWQALYELRPALLCYALSFTFIGIYWNNHHHLLHTVKRVSALIMWTNLNLLFWLSLVPFATAWMGENDFTTVPVAVYAALLLMCGLAFTFLTMAIIACHRDDRDVSDLLMKQRPKYILSTIGYVIAIPAAYIHTGISLAIFTLIAAVWFIPNREIERKVEE